MESFFTAAAVLLWIIIDIIGLAVAVGILSGIGYGLLLFVAKIKKVSRKHKLNKRSK
jgi:Na+/H+ antiporter NhaA